MTETVRYQVMYKILQMILLNLFLYSDWASRMWAHHIIPNCNTRFSQCYFHSSYTNDFIVDFQCLYYNNSILLQKCMFSVSLSEIEK